MASALPTATGAAPNMQHCPSGTSNSRQIDFLAGTGGRALNTLDSPMIWWC
jgi:hypothetical protein